MNDNNRKIQIEVFFIELRRKNKMSIRRDEFVVGINYEDRIYTPKQVLEYIENTNGEGFADLQKLEALKKYY